MYSWRGIYRKAGARVSEKRIQSFAEFWPYYVGEHSDRTNRRLHFIGTSLVIGLALMMLATRRPWLALLLPVAGYGFAWFGHFVIEKNKPASWTYPLWSLLADFKMFGLTCVGKMEAEVAAFAVSRRNQSDKLDPSGQRGGQDSGVGG